MNGEKDPSPLIGLLFDADDNAAPDGYHQGEVLAEIYDGMFLVADIGWGSSFSDDHSMYEGHRWVLYVVPLTLMRGFHFRRRGPGEGRSETVTFPPEVFEITRNPLVIEAKEYHLNQKPLRGFVKVGEFVESLLRTGRLVSIRRRAEWVVFGGS